MMQTRTTLVETYADGSKVGERTVTYTVSDEQVNDEAIRAAALQALATNRTYAALASPTAAQTAAQVKALSRQNNGLIRLLLGLLDGTD